MCSLIRRWRWQYAFQGEKADQCLASPAEQHRFPSPFWSTELFSKNQKPFHSIPFLKKKGSHRTHRLQLAPLNAKRGFLPVSVLADSFFTGVVLDDQRGRGLMPTDFQQLKRRMKQGLFCSLTFLLLLCFSFHSWFQLEGTRHTSARGSAKTSANPDLLPVPLAWAVLVWSPGVAQLRRRKAAHTAKCSYWEGQTAGLMFTVGPSAPWRQCPNIPSVL